MSARRYLFIGNFVGFAGGIERFAFAWARRLAAEGHAVDYVGAAPSRDAALFRTAFARVFAAVPEGDYDEVVIHKLPDLGTVRALKARFGEKLAFFAHDHDLYCPRRHYYTPFGRTNCTRAFAPLRCFLCAAVTNPRNWPRLLGRPSAALLAELRGVRAYVISAFMKANLVKNGFSPARVTILACELPPAEPLRLRTAAEGPLRLLFSGQLIAGKGGDLFLETLARLAVPYTATVLGDGKDRAKLERCARARALKVDFPGWVADPTPYYRAADLLLFTSRWQEPYGLVGAEAIARGVPVIAFDVGGVREWLKPGINGRLVPPGDVAALAAAVTDFATHTGSSALGRG